MLVSRHRVWQITAMTPQADDERIYPHTVLQLEVSLWHVFGLGGQAYGPLHHGGRVADAGN